MVTNGVLMKAIDYLVVIQADQLTLSRARHRNVVNLLVPILLQEARNDPLLIISSWELSPPNYNPRTLTLRLNNHWRENTIQLEQLACEQAFLLNNPRPEDLVNCAYCAWKYAMVQCGCQE